MDGRNPKIPRRLSLLLLTLLQGLATALAAAGGMDIAVTEPSVGDGDTIIHDSETLRVRGEVSGDAEIREVTVNGRPAALGSRDLVVEELVDEPTPFRAIVTLEPGSNAIEVKAVATDGRAAVLRFTVQLKPGTRRGEAYALIVAVDDYQDPRISDLRYAEADARAVQAALTHPQYGVVPPGNVVLLTGSQATYRNISRALEEHLVRQATRPEDVAFFYFAGHGAEGVHVSRGAAYYLVPHDAEATSLLSTAIDKGRLQFLWGAIGAQRKIFITDACHSGGMQNMKVLSAKGFETVEGFITLAAARADQRSWELPRLGHGIFTYCLTQGLQGAADREGGDGDGFVSAAELGAYLHAQVGKLAAEIDADQTPVVDLVPGADQTLLATSNGQPLPAWNPGPPPQAASFSSAMRITMRFGNQDRLPHLLVAIQDEEGDPDAAQVAATAVMAGLMKAGSPFRLIEPGAVAGALDADQALLAFSDAPADVAAVARAVAADLILTGRFKTEASGMDDEEMAQLLGTRIKSFQAHLNARVIHAATGEIIQAQNVQTAAVHINPTMARRKALEAACEKLAKQIRQPLLARWNELLRQQPAGLLTAENVDDFQVLARLEEALSGLEPVVRAPRWQSFADEAATFTFDPGGSAAETAAQLQEKGLPGFKIGGVKANAEELTFWAE